MNKLYCLIIMFITYRICEGQNLVPNGGFESYTSLPTGPGQYSKANGWSNCNGYGSPDYFHMNGSGSAQLPACFEATVYPHSGDATMGFVTWHSQQLFREYISHIMLQPLSIGQAYLVSFYLTNGINNGDYAGYGSNQVGVAFSTDSLMQVGFPNINITPQFATSTIFYDSTWQYFSFVLIADSAYNYITIGNFANDSNTIYQQFFSTNFEAAYYHIDDISVTSASAINSLEENETIRLFPVPFNKSLTIQSSLNELIEISLFDIASRKLLDQKFANSVSLITEQLAKGIYLYEVRNKNGVIKKGKVVKE